MWSSLLVAIEIFIVSNQIYCQHTQPFCCCCCCLYCRIIIVFFWLSRDRNIKLVIPWTLYITNVKFSLMVVLVGRCPFIPILCFAHSMSQRLLLYSWTILLYSWTILIEFKLKRSQTRLNFDCKQRYFRTLRGNTTTELSYSECQFQCLWP